MPRPSDTTGVATGTITQGLPYGNLQIRMMPCSIMRIALYARVSTEEQATEGLSLESQEKRMKAYCAAREDWTVQALYTDPGHTGLDTNRPGYKAMIDDIYKWDVVLVVKADRLHRNSENAQEFLRDMLRTRKQVWSIAENRMDTPGNAAQWFGSMITTVLLPEMESRQISERVLPAMELAKDIGLHQGRPPTGFVWVKKLKRFVPTEWGEKIRADASQYGLSEAAKMNTWPAGTKRRGKDKGGSRLNKTTVWRITKNFEEYEARTLLPNRRRTKSGDHSKFKVE